MSAANEDEGSQISTIELNEAIHSRHQVAVATVTIDQQALTVPVHGRRTLERDDRTARRPRARGHLGQQ